MRNLIGIFLIIMICSISFSAEKKKSDSDKKKSSASKTAKKDKKESKSKEKAKADKDKEKDKDKDKPKKAQAKKKPSANQKAVVKVEGAMVYQAASFDAPVITYLPFNKKIEVSKKTYGPFYRVRVKKGVIGYISDVDIEIAGGKKPPAQGMFAQEQQKSHEDAPAEGGGESFERSRKSLEAATVMGGSLALLRYTEKFTIRCGADLCTQMPIANVPMFGLKLTGEEFFLPTLLDINLNFALKPPNYYDQTSTSPPSGYMMMLDTQMIFPFMSSEDMMVYLGTGPFINYSSFKVVLNNTLLKMDMAKLGVVGSAGIAVRMGTLVLKLEGRYHYDGNAYSGAILGIQFSR